MKKAWKALRSRGSSSPTMRNEHSRQQTHGTESLTGKGPVSLHHGTNTVYTNGQPLQDVQQQQQFLEAPRASSMRANGSGPANSPQPQHQVVYVNDMGHRVTSTTVRVPPPPPPPSPASSSQMVPYSSAMPPNIVRQIQVEAAVDPIHAANDLTRNLVKKFIADIWNRGEIDLIPEVCSPNLRFNGNTGFDRIGHDGLARMVATIREALDEYHCEIHSMVVENNKAFCRLRFTGKHTGPLLGYAPTHKVVAWMGATEFTCQNGKILKVWELGDVKSLEEQLQPAKHFDEDEI